MSNPESPNDMSQLAGRAKGLIDTITGGILNAAEAAARSAAEAALQQVELASAAAKVSEQMQAFGDVLEMLATKKEGIEAKLVNAKGASRTLLQRQLDLLTAHETDILTRAGIAPEAAQLPLAGAAESETLYRRQGKRFLPVANGMQQDAQRLANGNGGLANHDDSRN